MRGARQLVVVNGAPSIEGDIVSPSRGSSDLTTSNAHIANPDRLWPGGKVPYQFDPDFYPEHIGTMLEVMRYFEEKVPCLNFTEKTETTIDYVLIYPGAKCDSKVGRVGGKQVLNLNRYNLQ